MSNEGVLTRPRCSHCGYQVESVTIVGAGCPKCTRRLGLETPRGAGGPDLTAENVRLIEIVQSQEAELLELRQKVLELAATNPAPAPAPDENAGGGQ